MPGGPTEALEHLVRAEYTRLVRAVAVIATDVAAAEDAVQEALTRAWDRLDRGETIDDLGAWVVTVALNVTRSSLRISSRTVGLEHDGPVVPTSGRIAEALDLRRAVRALPPRQREVVVLHYFLDLDVRSVAALVRRSEGSVKNALFHARAALAKALGDPTEVLG